MAGDSVVKSAFGVSFFALEKKELEKNKKEKNQTFPTAFRYFFNLQKCSLIRHSNSDWINYDDCITTKHFASIQNSGLFDRNACQLCSFAAQIHKGLSVY